jgi:hypothetical protein
MNDQVFMYAQTAVVNKDQKRFTPTGAVQNMTINDFSRDSRLKVSEKRERPKSASGYEKRTSQKQSCNDTMSHSRQSNSQRSGGKSSHSKTCISENPMQYENSVIY